MAFSPRAVLRPVCATATLAVLVAGFAGAAAAQDAGDSPAGQGGYHGRFLSWVGKTPAPAPVAAPARARPDDAAATYVVQRRTAPVAEPAPERAPPPPAVAEEAPAPYIAPSPPQPAPERAPPRVAEQTAPAPYMAQPTPTRAPLAPAAPARAAAAAAPDQTAAAATPAGSSPRVHVHIYSVDRPYGMTPDPIAMPTKRPMVLVGPPDASASPPQNGADDGDGGKPAPHDDGQGARGAGDQPGDN